MLVKFSANHYLLGGVVYSADLGAEEHTALREISTLAPTPETLALAASAFGFVNPGEVGELLGSTYANGMPTFRVKFSSGEVLVDGRFLSRE